MTTGRNDAGGTVRIARVDAWCYRVPIANRVVTSFGAMTSRPAVFVRLEDTDGAFGWGEIFANWPAAGAEHRARLLVEDVSDLLFDTAFSQPSDLFEHLRRETHIRALQCGEWGPFAHVISGLDIAFHDLLARRAGKPLARFLNPGSASSVPTYASGIHIRDADRVRRASVLAMHAGADFIKTSTGKIQPAATMQVTLTMLQAIRDYYYETGRMVGMKPAGGISSAKLALHYLVMLQETLGNAWMTPEWFRFGASSLANDVLMQLKKQETGVYQSPDYFSKD